MATNKTRQFAQESPASTAPKYSGRRKASRQRQVASSWGSILRRRLAEIVGQNIGTIVHRPCDALKAKPLQAAPKAVRQLAVNVNVERLVADCVAFHAFGHNRKRRRAPAKLALPLGEHVGAPKVCEDLFKHVLEAPIARRAAVSVALKHEKPIAVRQGGPMLAQPAVDLRYSFCGFHALAYGPKRAGRNH
jgi:hypothetical protein